MEPSALADYVETGMPSKTRNNITIIIIPAIISGISRRKIARTTIAIRLLSIK
jgi:hypothetical protein